MAAHDAKRHLRPAVLGEHAGDDGMQGAFAGLDTVGVAGIDDEPFTTVLQNYAAFWRYLSGTKGGKEGVDETDGVAVLVDYTQIDRALMAREVRGRQPLDA